MGTIGKSYIKDEEPFRYRNYDKAMSFAIALEVVGLFILAIAFLFLVIDAIFDPNTAFILVVVGLCCGIPAALLLLYLVFRKREQRKRQVEHLYKGDDIDTVIGNTKDEELAQNLQLVREAHEKEQEKLKEQEKQLEQEINTLHTEIDKKEPQATDDLHEERARLLEQREQLEKDKAASEAFAKQQLESALLGKGQLDLVQADRVRVAMLLAEKERLEKERALRTKLYLENRKENHLIKKAILGRQNIEVLVKKYFVEVAGCFLMNRDAYKDQFGLAPYNKIINSKIGGEATHIMAATEDRFWRFAETLVDVERFLKHPILFNAFEKFTDAKMPLVLISEKLHYMYLQKNIRKDFVKNYTYKEDFENLLILVNNNHLRNASGLNTTTWEIFGFNSFDEAMRISTIGANTQGKTPGELVATVLKMRPKR